MRFFARWADRSADEDRRAGRALQPEIACFAMLGAACQQQDSRRPWVQKQNLSWKESFAFKELANPNDLPFWRFPLGPPNTNSSGF